MDVTKRWIGIDGGGTKTSCVIGDDDGHMLAHAMSSSSNINSIPAQKVFETITLLIEKVLQDSSSSIQDIDNIQLCLAGADREREKSLITNLFKNTPYESKIKIKNDAQAALAAGTWGEPGLLLVAGTGSIVYGVTNAGTSFRVGGWGYLFGDEGSGFFIGKKAVNAVFQAFDNRGRTTELTALILNHFQFQHVPDLVRLYAEENMIPVIAELSKYVLHAARNGDSVALDILEETVHELTCMVDIASQKQSLDRIDLLVLHGGLFSDAYFKSLFIKRINFIQENLQVTQPEIPAVVGAYLLALKESGQTIGEKVKENIRLSWENKNATRRRT